MDASDEASPPHEPAPSPPPNGPACSHPAGMRNAIITGNIQGLYPKNKQYKIERMREMAIMNDALIISLTESHLNDDILDAEIKIDGFYAIRQDRASSPKGGIITYIKDSVSTTAKVVATGSKGHIEYLCIYFRDKNLLFITIYRPPSENHQQFYEILKIIEDFITSLPTSPSIVLTGDFNYPNIRWMNGIAVSTQGSAHNSPNSLLNFASRQFLTQIIDQPTRGRNILDLLFTNNDDIFSKIEVSEIPFLSDHNLIVMY